MSTDSNIIINPGAYVITVAFTRKPGLVPPTVWEANQAAQNALDEFGREYLLDSVQVVSIEQAPGTVTMPAAEYRRIMALVSRASDPADANA